MLSILMKTCMIFEISGAGHLSNLEQPTIFNRVLQAFLADAEAD